MGDKSTNNLPRDIEEMEHSFTQGDSSYNKTKLTEDNMKAQRQQVEEPSLVSRNSDKKTPKQLTKFWQTPTPKRVS